MNDSSLLTELQTLHAPEYRKVAIFGDSNVIMGGKTYIRPRPGTEEFKQAMRKQLDTPICAHCHTEYPCATAQIFMTAHTPGESTGNVQARARFLYDSLFLVRDAEVLGMQRRSWRDRLLGILTRF